MKGLVIAAILAISAAALQAEMESRINFEALIGSAIINRVGEKVGTLQEFIVEPQTKHVQFAVVESGGVLDLGAKSYLVPWVAFHLEQNSEDHTAQLILDTTVEKLRGSIEFDRSKPIPANQVDAYWAIER